VLGGNIFARAQHPRAARETTSKQNADFAPPTARNARIRCVNAFDHFAAMWFATLSTATWSRSVLTKWRAVRWGARPESSSLSSPRWVAGQAGIVGMKLFHHNKLQVDVQDQIHMAMIPVCRRPRK